MEGLAQRIANRQVPDTLLHKRYSAKAFAVSVFPTPVGPRNRILREYKLHKLRLMILARLLYGKKIDLVIDGTIVAIANVNRARTQKIRRVRGKVWRAKRRRKIVRRDNGKVVEFEEVRYGMLMICLLYTSPSPRDISGSRMPSSA